MGYFYQRTREYCRAAISRYEGVLQEFPDYQGVDEVLYRLSECLGNEGRAAEALPYLSRIIEQYPRSEFAASAKELMSSLASATPARPPHPDPHADTRTHRPVVLKCHFRLCKKGLDGSSFFLLASAKLPASRRVWVGRPRPTKPTPAVRLRDGAGSVQEVRQ